MTLNTQDIISPNNNNPRKLPKHPQHKEKQHPPIIRKCRNKKTQSKSQYILQPKLEHTQTKINSQHSQQQIERHVFEFMKLIITV
jgi:hypothetical protein